jgi:hypothetical protein
LNRLAKQSVWLVGICQDSDPAVRDFIEQTSAAFPIEADADLRLSQAYDPFAVPAFFLLNAERYVIRTQIGFDKTN